MKNSYNKIGVVIPCYKVKNYINNVLLKIPKNVKKIIVVDDKCLLKSTLLKYNE